MSELMDKIFIALGVLIIAFIVAFLLSVAIHSPQEKDCVRNGGEPYYFIDLSFECRNNVNVSIGDAHE